MKNRKKKQKKKKSAQSKKMALLDKIGIQKKEDKNLSSSNEELNEGGSDTSESEYYSAYN